MDCTSDWPWTRTGDGRRLYIRLTIGGLGGRVITITQSGTGGGGRCGSDQTLTIDYSNVTVPTPAATPQTYSFVFDDGPDPTVTVTAPPAVSVAVSPTSMAEDAAGNLTYTFTRAGDAGSNTGSITVSFSVSGTATFRTRLHANRRYDLHVIERNGHVLRRECDSDCEHRSVVGFFWRTR